MSRLAVVVLVLGMVAGTAAAEEEPISVRGEVIRVQGKAPKPTPPKATNYVPSKAPPYSDHAILSDAWARAWLLLEVSETGTVMRIKFLNRPGYDLDAIALSEAFKLTFTPALDPSHTPMRSMVLWTIEWPSAYWLQELTGTRSRMPPMKGIPPHRLDSYVPCKGSGPLNLDSAHPVYRDCSRPNFAKAATERWIGRPASATLTKR
jgi:hypothetical protein